MNVNLILAYVLLFSPSLLVLTLRLKHFIHISTLLIFSLLVINTTTLTGMLTIGLVNLRLESFTDFITYALCDVILILSLISFLINIPYHGYLASGVILHDMMFKWMDLW